MSVDVLTAAAARRTVVAAQGLGRDRPTGPVTRAHLNRVLERIRLLQLDSVSVAVRAHYAPVFARLGPYDRTLLDAAAWNDSAGRPRLLAEYWAHEAALIPVADWPLFRWRMRDTPGLGWRAHTPAPTHGAGLAEDVVAALGELGPTTAGGLELHLHGGRRRRGGTWWDRSDTKLMCEHLFSTGVLSTATRVGFARHYDLSVRVLGPEVLAREVHPDDAVRTLVAQAAAALGVATVADLQDYYRLSRARTVRAIGELVDGGVLTPITVRGWDAPAHLHREARVPRRIDSAALLCPFDPLIFFRPRTERVFGFRYRIEIYTPAAKRRHGYYVFPFLVDGELVARVDLKADRVAGVLRVPGAFVEPGVEPGRVAERLVPALAEMASWLGLDDVVVGERGDLVAALTSAGRATRPPGSRTPVRRPSDP